MDKKFYSYLDVLLVLSERRSITVTSVVADLGGTARTGDIMDAGVHPRDLYAARDAGELVEVARGVFRLADLPLTEPGLVAVATRMPRAVLCLVTALHLHGLTVEIPRAVHVALPRGVHPGRLDHPLLEVYHFSSASYAAGVEERQVDGLAVRVTTPAKSVADSFKFRRRLGLELAIDALKYTLAQGAATVAEIDEMARVDRVDRVQQAVIRPYLEALACSSGNRPTAQHHSAPAPRRPSTGPRLTPQLASQTARILMFDIRVSCPRAGRGPAEVSV